MVGTQNFQNKWGRLGRYMDRNEPTKKVLNSWDQDLSIGDTKRSTGGQLKCKKGNEILMFWAIKSRLCFRQHDCGCFCVAGGPETSNLDLKNKFCRQIWLKILKMQFRSSKISQNIQNPFLDFLYVFDFRSKIKFLTKFSILFNFAHKILSELPL